MFAKVKNKKGFTLVELIVVLVILAILAALLVPALTGYIDKAKEKKLVAETRMVVTAVQTVVSEAYGQLGADKDFITEDWTFHAASGSTPASDGKYIQEIKKLAEVFDSNPKATFYAVATEQGKVLTLSYINGVYTCKYNADEQSYTTTKNTSTIPLPGSWVEFHKS